MGKNIEAPVKAFILLVFLTLVFSLAVLDNGSQLNRINLSDPSTLLTLKLTQALSAIIIFIIPTFVFVFSTSEKKMGYLKLAGFNPILAAAAAALVITALPVINWLGELNSQLALPESLYGLENWMKTKEENLKELTRIFLDMHSLSDLVLNLIIIALLAAIGEELLFRGALQNTLIEWFRNTHVAIWVTAILFSALHAQFYGFIPRMLLGVILGYLYVWSGSLWLSIIFHFVNNGMAVLLAYLAGKGIIPGETENIGTGDSSLLFVMTSLIISLALLYYIYHNREHHSALQPEK